MAANYDDRVRKRVLLWARLGMIVIFIAFAIIALKQQMWPWPIVFFAGALMNAGGIAWGVLSTRRHLPR